MSVSIITLNSVVVRFYLSKQETMLHFMYLILAGTDIIAGLSALLQFFTILFLILDLVQTATKIIPVSFFLTSLTSHSSVFYNMVLVVVRTINIVFPTRSIPKKAIIVCIFSTPILWTAVNLYEITSLYMINDYVFTTYNQVFLLIVATNAGSELLYMLLKNHSSRRWLTHSVCIGIPYIVPSLITITCCVIQVLSLRRIRISGQSTQRNRTITITILQLTAVFLVCNTAHFSVLFYLNIAASEQKLEHWFILYIAGTIMPLLNSFINPMILIIRGQSLRSYFLDIVRNVTQCHPRKGLTLNGPKRYCNSSFSQAAHTTKTRLTPLHPIRESNCSMG